ncbi:hypothetical protein [Oceanobacillus manasiensis]|uniref:hypothetical protein n=1 Tax=Oceanobacillus manasiensis TaxID=586413 RepID=UPI0012EBA2C2|nr:hypothetical protein [Oceanobacillus manasiensis]
MTIEVKNHEQTWRRSGYRSLKATTVDEVGREYTHSTINGGDVVTFIEEAITDVLRSLLDQTAEPSAITVNVPTSVTISEALKTHLTDKYEADPVISTLAIV